MRYFFALNLTNLPQLSVPRRMSSIESEHCVISIVEGQSDDRTYEFLAALKMHVEALGTQLLPSTAPSTPKQKAKSKSSTYPSCTTKTFEPLKVSAATGPINELDGMFSPDALVIFINDVALCPEDVLWFSCMSIRTRI